MLIGFCIELGFGAICYIFNITVIQTVHFSPKMPSEITCKWLIWSAVLLRINVFFCLYETQNTLQEDNVYFSSLEHSKLLKNMCLF